MQMYHNKENKLFNYCKNNRVQRFSDSVHLYSYDINLYSNSVLYTWKMYIFILIVYILTAILYICTANCTGSVSYFLSTSINAAIYICRFFEKFAICYFKFYRSIFSTLHLQLLFYLCLWKYFLTNLMCQNKPQTKAIQFYIGSVSLLLCTSIIAAIYIWYEVAKFAICYSKFL